MGTALARCGRVLNEEKGCKTIWTLPDAIERGVTQGVRAAQ